jgi:hypothetical protein
LTAVATGTGLVVHPSVASLLHRAVRAERRRVLAWLLAGVVSTGVALLLVSQEAALIAGLIAATLTAWSARQVAGIALARRDFLRADTPTGRRSWSKPRWVRADAGICRAAPAVAVRALVRAHLAPVPAAGEELPLEGSLLAATAKRIGFLAAFTAVVLVLS